MSANTMLLLQSIGIMLQMINASLGSVVKNPTVSLVVGAAIGGYQFYVQHIGNSATPQAK